MDWVEEKEGLIRRFHQAEKFKNNPVICPDLFYERAVGHGHGTFFYQDGKFRFWYQSFGMPTKKHGTFFCSYAESYDGITWIKPELGLIEIEGNKNNNVVLTDTANISIIDDNRETDKQKRYKMLYFGRGERNDSRALLKWMGCKGYWGWCLAYSSDGLEWKKDPGNPVYCGADDEGALLGWDESRKAYTAYLRPWGKERNQENDPMVDKFPHTRMIGLTTTKDFKDWSPCVTVIAPDSVDGNKTQFYDMPIVKYHDYYLGMLYMHYCDPDDPATMNHRGFMDVQLCYSRDGTKWQRVDNVSALIPRGGRGEFDMGMVGLNQGCVLKDGKLWFYYNAWTGEHYETKAYRRVNDPGHFEMGRLASAIGLAWLREDGFVSVEAGEDPGGFTTREMEGSENGFFLNGAVNARHGYIKAEWLDETGRPVEGYKKEDFDTFNGDSLDYPLTWKGKKIKEGYPGKRGKLRFYMKNSQLFSLTIT